MKKIGLIGVGKWGQNHLRTLSELDCNLIGISDVDLKKKEFAMKYGIKFYPDFHQLLKEVDSVIIANPTNLHYDTVLDCLNKGKNVLVEKPIALNSDQSKKLIEIAYSKNLILSVGYLFRFNNSINRVKELLKKIGEIQYITCRYIHSTKPPRNDSGSIINLSIHPIDILNYITEKKPIKVYAKKKNLLSEKFEDSAIILIDYKDFFASIEVSCTHPEKKRDMWIIAEKEKIYVDYLKQKIVRYPIIINYNKVEKKDPINENILANEPLKEELQFFIKIINEKNNKKFKKIKNIGEENYYTTRACELCIKSATNGKEFDVI